jgi:hypothetical protein
VEVIKRYNKLKNEAKLKAFLKTIKRDAVKKISRGINTSSNIK